MPPISSADPTTVCILGVAAALMGMAGLLRRGGRGTRSLWLSPLVVALLLAVVGASAFAAGAPECVWLPSLSLSCVWLVFTFLRTPLLEKVVHGSAAVMCQPRVQSAGLFAAAGLVLGWQVWALDREVEQEWAATSAVLTPLGQTGEMVAFAGPTALTDAGNIVPLFRLSQVETGASEEARYLVQRGMSLKAIQTGSVSADYNCHGWVFTAGRCWVRSSSVEQILRDNQYQAVSSPAVGDLAIYRDGRGEISHTALVRSVGTDGVILVESKWGKIGRYIHRPDDHIYPGNTCTWYHTTRGGHVLRGLEDRPTNGSRANEVHKQASDQRLAKAASSKRHHKGKSHSRDGGKHGTWPALVVCRWKKDHESSHQLYAARLCGWGSAGRTCCAKGDRREP